MSDSEVVRAAGGVVWRSTAHGDEVLLVHRTRHDDWSLPKGKLDPGETWEQAAVREVFEETGVVAVLEHELPGTDYLDGRGRPKHVRYWAMAVAADVGIEPNDEISERRWFDLPGAVAILTYDRDRAVLGEYIRSRSGSTHGA